MLFDFACHFTFDIVDGSFRASVHIHRSYDALKHVRKYRGLFVASLPAFTDSEPYIFVYRDPESKLRQSFLTDEIRSQFRQFPLGKIFKRIIDICAYNDRND